MMDGPRRHPPKGKGPGEAGIHSDQGEKSTAGGPGPAGTRQGGTRAGGQHPLKWPRVHEKIGGPTDYRCSTTLGQKHRTDNKGRKKRRPEKPKGQDQEARGTKTRGAARQEEGRGREPKGH